jgi:hypothetical protein
MAIRLPSGETAQWPTFPPFVRRLRPPPSAFLTKIAARSDPGQALVKTICLPSGDHCGHTPCTAPFVGRTLPEPSAFMSQMVKLDSPASGSPEWQAILVSSGDQAGLRASNRWWTAGESNP